MPDARLMVNGLIERCIDRTAEQRRIDTVIDSVVAAVEADPQLVHDIIEEYVRFAYRQRDWRI